MRIAIPVNPIVITLYTRAGCHLCEEAKTQMMPLLREYGVALREVDIDQDPALRAEYDHDVPVIFLGDRKVAKHRVDLAQLRRQLAHATAL
jgi:glutaredoxin